MRARIGIAESSKVIEIDVEDVASFRGEIEAALSSTDSISWFTDAKKRSVGIPTGRIAFVEVDADGASHSVGFSPGS